MCMGMIEATLIAVFAYTTVTVLLIYWQESGSLGEWVGRAESKLDAAQERLIGET